MSEEILYNKQFEKKFTFSLKNGSLHLSNGIVIDYHHSQNCCENVYADFDSLKDTTIDQQEYSELSIEGVPDYGIKINGFGVPCYNIQNGYYSSELNLTINYNNGQSLVIDIEKFEQDHLD